MVCRVERCECDGLLKLLKSSLESYLLSKAPYLAGWYVDLNFDLEPRVTNIHQAGNIVAKNQSVVCSLESVSSQLHLVCILKFIFIFPDGSCQFQENGEKQISVDEDTPPGNKQQMKNSQIWTSFILYYRDWAVYSASLPKKTV